LNEPNVTSEAIFQRSLDFGGELSQSGAFVEEAAQRQVDAVLLAQAGDQLRAEHGVSAKLHELVVAADEGNPVLPSTGRRWIVRAAC